MYKTNEETEERMDLSVGEDLETFIGRIKNGEINKDTIPEYGEHTVTFLLCLLDKEERKNATSELPLVASLHTGPCMKETTRKHIHLNNAIKRFM